jgi:hypothetical protein
MNRLHRLLATAALMLTILLGGLPFGGAAHAEAATKKRATSSTRARASRTVRSTRRTSRTKASSTAGKTVHVRPYTKKNGTHVAAYNRRPPSSKGTKAAANAKRAPARKTSTGK